MTTETIEQLDKPWHLLSEEMKLWIKNNGFLIKEYSTVSAIVFPEWKAAYIKAKFNLNE